MIGTSDAELAERVRLLRSHGMTTLTWDRHRGHAGGYDVLAQGFNYRLDEIRAAMGSVQLRRLPDENAARARVAGLYRSALDGERGLKMPFARDEEGSVSSHHLAVVLLPAGTDRDAVRAALSEKRIQTSVHYPPIHLFTQYRESGAGRPLPRTEEVASRLLTLPLYGRMSDAQVEPGHRVAARRALETAAPSVSCGQSRLAPIHLNSITKPCQNDRKLLNLRWGPR